MSQKGKIFLYDTTLRDGAQRKGISYSLDDKLEIVKILDSLGIDYIEGGWPGSNPKDELFFHEVNKLSLSHSKIVAFGSTRKALTQVEDDLNIKMLLSSPCPAVALVGKSWTLHVKEVLRTTLDENLLMISDSVSYCAGAGREVVYDAEHFFDGYKSDQDYALATLQAAKKAGATWLVLCDTNGGTLPDDIARIVKEVRSHLGDIIGIHTHNDCELAVANSLAAVNAGARHVQGTINGYGERCGNANLVSLIALLQHKQGYDLIPESKLKLLSYVSRFVSERANVSQDEFQAFVGSAAFAHKGGIHVAAVERIQESYEHMRPEIVGNSRNIIISELSGRGNIRMLAKEWGVVFDNSTSNSSSGNPLGGAEKFILEEIKRRESEGYQYEGAEGSVELLMRQAAPEYELPFEILDYVVVAEKKALPNEENLEGVQAIIKLRCKGEVVHTAAEGDGPVHALDFALRKALIPFYGELENLKLSDYKVRILDPENATNAITRVLIEAHYGSQKWSTLGCGRNIISASFKALTESYSLLISRLYVDIFKKNEKIKVNS